MLGLGPLEPLLEDDSITDIMVMDPELRLVERGGSGPIGHPFDSAHVANISQLHRPASAIGRRIDESYDGGCALKTARASTLCFASGARRTVYFDPKILRQQIDFAKIGELRLLTPAGCTRAGSGRTMPLNVVISGGTGSGTTLMNAMPRLIDHGERIITRYRASCNCNSRTWHAWKTRPQS